MAAHQTVSEAMSPKVGIVEKIFFVAKENYIRKKRKGIHVH